MSKASFSPPPSKKRKLDTDEIDTLSPISRVMHFVNSDTNEADYFSILQLPSPTVDALDRLTWSAPKHEIRKQYLKLSRQVHPDRFVGDDAQSKRAAHCFDLVHTAYRTLADDVEREQYLSAFQTRNRQKLKDDEEDESGCTNDLRNPNSQFKRKQSRRRKMMEQEADEYAKQVMNEFHQRRMRSKMKQVRTEQQQRRDMQNKTQSSTVCDNEECDSAEDDIDIMKTLTKLKRKQKQKKRF